MFYTNEAGDFAAALQKGLNALTEGHDRACKKAEGIYLMDHITAPGVLIECGFLSNPAEEANLLRPEYQKKLCAVIAGSAAQYLESEMVG